jgi:hypothetical protein
MNMKALLLPVACLALAPTLVGCGASRDVEVSGEIGAATTVQTEGKIVLRFFDVIGEGEEQELSDVHSVNLSSLGAFKESVSLEGDSVLIRAIDDRNADGACSEGEPWAEATAAISDDDTVEAVKLTLENKACPAN